MHVSLAISFYFLCAQYISDINISIVSNLRQFCKITILVVLVCKYGGFSITVNYVILWCVLDVTCLVVLFYLVSVFLLIQTLMVISALRFLCPHVCSVFCCLIGNALLIYYVIVNMRLHIPWFDMCWIFYVFGLE